MKFWKAKSGNMRWSSMIKHQDFHGYRGKEETVPRKTQLWGMRLDLMYWYPIY